MAKLVFIRHGQSEWNLKNLFTGWEDVNLSDKVLKKLKQQDVNLKKQVSNSIKLIHQF